MYMKKLGFNLKKAGILVLSSLILLTGTLTGCGTSGDPAKPAATASKELPVIKVSLQPSFESFASYNGAQKGWDKEAGFKQEINGLL